MAHNLPLELRQQIFALLDPRSFCASRRVCRSWHRASLNAFTLCSQLQRLPFTTNCSRRSDDDLTALDISYNRIAHEMLLDMEIRSQPPSTRNLVTPVKRPGLTMSADGRLAVSLAERLITVYERADAAAGFTIRYQRLLTSLRTGHGEGPRFKRAPTSAFQLGLSPDGKLLAVALDRTIQIYDLTADADSAPASSYISAAAGHYIVGAEFEGDNNLLRVRLSNKGAVVYLGSPRDGQGDLDHWSSQHGLRNVFASSAFLLTDNSGELLMDLQLLHQWQHGWLFAAQSARNGRSPTYRLGYLPSNVDDGESMIVGRRVRILAQLQSDKPNLKHHEGFAFPAAEGLHTEWALSSDGALIVLAGQSVWRSAVDDQRYNIFAYRMPRLEELHEMATTRPWAGNIELAKQCGNDGLVRIPMPIGVAEGKLLNLEVGEAAGPGIYVVKAATRGEYLIQATSKCTTSEWVLSPIQYGRSITVAALSDVNSGDKLSGDLFALFRYPI